MFTSFFQKTSNVLFVLGLVGLFLFAGFFQSVSANGAVEITTWAQLDAVRDNLSGSYILMNDLNANSAGYATYAGPGANTNAGWAPIGDGLGAFTGSFNGNSNTISDLYINRPSQESVGLFGYAAGATLTSVLLKDVDITGGDNVGGLVGDAWPAVISNSYTTGTVTGAGGAGYIGGLVGFLGTNSALSNSYSTAVVTGHAYVGGLVGYNLGATINRSYSVGSVTVTGNNNNLGGGLIGESFEGTITNSFWDTQTSGRAISDGGTGKTTEEMKNIATFTTDLGAAAWDFNTVWTMAGYPHLQDEWTTQISTCSELQMMKLNLTAEYVLVDDVDCSDTAIWNDQQGFEPIGYFDEGAEDESGVFTGSLDGDGYEISNLFMNWIDVLDMNQGGLFGAVYEAEIKNIYLTDVNISFNYEWGAVGSLVGIALNSVLNNIHSTGTITGETYVGGLVGVLSEPDISPATITNSSVAGSVTGTNYIGGLVGLNEGGTIVDSSVTNTVNGIHRVGGLVGHNDSATISNSFATGNVTGDSDVGGLVGYSYDSTISNSYSTGNAMGTDLVGGLVGFGDEGTISNSYAIGSVTGDSDVGGLVGHHYYTTITNSFWDTQTSGQTESAGGEGKTTAQMKAIATFTTELGEDAWDFDEIWGMSNAYNNGYACLLWDEDCPEFDPLMVTTGSAIDIEKDSATLRATITAGIANAYGFFWGTTSHSDDALPQEMELDTGAIFEALLELYEDTDGIGGEGIEEAPFYYEIPIGDLVCNTTYYFRPIVFRDYSFGGSPEDVTIGNELSFTTLGCHDGDPTPAPRRSSGGQASPVFLAQLGITTTSDTQQKTVQSLMAEVARLQKLLAELSNNQSAPITPNTPQPVLRIGSTGESVLLLQRWLGVQPQSGRFINITDTAVKAFQRQHGLQPDGIVGPATWAKLFAVFGSN